MIEYDLIVIGSGVAGRSAARAARNLGLSVAIFDYVKTAGFGNSWLIGGTNINSGDIPMYLFHHASLFHNSLKDAVKFGFNCHRDGYKFDWNAFINKTQLFCKTLALKYQTLLHKVGINFHNGYAVFLDKFTIEARGIDNMKYRALNFIVATGTQPYIPEDIPGYNLAITSNDFFSLNKKPDSVLILGCTSTSVECAGFLVLLGVSVTIVVDSTPLRNSDRECVTRIIEHLELLGVKFIWKYKLERIEESIEKEDIARSSSIQVEQTQTNMKSYLRTRGNGKMPSNFAENENISGEEIRNRRFSSHFRKVYLRKMNAREENHAFLESGLVKKLDQNQYGQNSKQGAHKMSPFIIETFEVVMFSQGRVSNVYNMRLTDVGVLTSHGGKVITDQYDETDCKSIYAIGDVVSGRPGLSSTADKWGKLLIDRIYSGSKRIINYDFVPRAILIPIKYSWIGLSEEEAIRIHGGERVEIYESNFRPLSWKIFKTHKRFICLAKMICIEGRTEEEEERIVGLHYIGPQADEIISGFELVLKLGVNRKTINDMVSVYPSGALIFTRLHQRPHRSMRYNPVTIPSSDL